MLLMRKYIPFFDNKQRKINKKHFFATKTPF